MQVRVIKRVADKVGVVSDSQTDRTVTLLILF